MARKPSSPAIVGIFGGADAVRRARAKLVAAGVPPASITASVPLTEDGIAAEAPGESFENQPGQSAPSNELAPETEAMRTGACTLTVELRGAEREKIESILAESGARGTLEREIRSKQ